MLGFVSSLLTNIGSIFANAGTSACFGFFFDEPECPKSLIK